MHAEKVSIELPCNVEDEHQLALRLSGTLLCPRRLCIVAAYNGYEKDPGEALGIPELSKVFSRVQEVMLRLPLSHSIASVSCKSGATPFQ
jgi:hypothetical protein